MKRTFGDFWDHPFSYTEEKIEKVFTDPGGLTKEVFENGTKFFGDGASKVMGLDDVEDDEGGILDFDGIFLMLIKKHLREAVMRIEVHEPIDINLQLEVQSTLSLTATGGYVYYPPNLLFPFWNGEVEINGGKNKVDFDHDDLKKGFKGDWTKFRQSFPRMKGE